MRILYLTAATQARYCPHKGCIRVVLSLNILSSLPISLYIDLDEPMGRIYASNSATSLAPFARLLIFISVMQLSKRFSLKIKIKFAAIFQPNSAWIKFELE